MSSGSFWGLVFLIVGSVSGFFIGKIYSDFNPDYINLMVYDSEDCMITSSTIFMDSLSITKKGEPSRKMWLSIYVNRHEPIEYSIKVDTKKCGVIESPLRSLDSGYIIYEYVSKNNISHEIRA